MTVREFTVDVPQSELDDLRARLDRTRWPRPVPGEPWELGSDAATLRRLVDRWRDGFDWRAQEAAINRLPQFVVELDGADVHFLHFRADTPSGPPLLLTHGWPGSFLEIAGLAERLAEAGFDAVVPSLPGFAFSAPRPEATDPGSTPRLWHSLMTDVLGYERYGAHGGDLGAGVTTRLGALHPQSVVGIHLLAAAPPSPMPAEEELSAGERAYVEQMRAWEHDEGGYEHEQQTRPVTLAHGLSDSPAGLLAWIAEKLRAWSDCDGDLSTRFSDDEVLTWVSLYWLTNTIATSFRPYSDFRSRPVAIGRVEVPTAIAVFPKDLTQPPREWVERRYDLVRYTPMPRGGHFAAFEEPDLLAQDITAFFGSLPGGREGQRR